jgi:hypothetical protein
LVTPLAINKLADCKRVPGIAVLPNFRLRNYLLLRKKYWLTLLLFTLFGIITLIYHTIPALDVVDHFWQTPRYSAANFVHREPVYVS